MNKQSIINLKYNVKNDVKLLNKIIFEFGPKLLMIEKVAEGERNIVVAGSINEILNIINQIDEFHLQSTDFSVKPFTLKTA